MLEKGGGGLGGHGGGGLMPGGSVGRYQCWLCCVTKAEGILRWCTGGAVGSRLIRNQRGPRHSLCESLRTTHSVGPIIIIIQNKIHIFDFHF